MSKEHDIKNALDSIKTLMLQEGALDGMSDDILDLTEIVGAASVVPTPDISHVLLKNGLDQAQLATVLQEILRPYLKTWLDNNLPAIVKNAVEKQIKLIVTESSK